MSDTSNVNLADLFAADFSIDSMSDGQVILPPGSSRGIITWGARSVTGKDGSQEPVITMDYVVTEILERTEGFDDIADPKPGTKTGTMFRMDGGLSEGQLKVLLKDLSEHANSKIALEIMDNTSGSEVVMQHGVRRVKKDGEVKTYQSWLHVAAV